MLEQCCNHSKQCCNNVATLSCPKNVKNRRCESSRVTSPLVEVQKNANLCPADQKDRRLWVRDYTNAGYIKYMRELKVFN